MKRFTLADALLIGLLSLCAAVPALSAWLEARKARFDTVAFQQVVEIRDHLYKVSKQADAHQALQVFNLREISQLPEPLSQINVKSGIRVHYIVHLKRDRGNIMLLSLSHSGGKFEHRWIDVYGARRQQKIELNT